VALHGPVAHQGAVVGGAVAADGDFALLAVVEEAPAVEQFAVAVEADAVAAGQFFDAVGLAVAGEVVGRCAARRRCIWVRSTPPTCAAPTRWPKAARRWARLCWRDSGLRATEAAPTAASAKGAG